MIDVKNVAIALVGCLLVGCSSATTPDETSSSAPPAASPWTTSTTPPREPCANPEASVPTGFAQFSNADIKAALEKAPLPPGVVIMNETDLFSIMQRSMIDVVVRICKPGLVGDPLKDVATTIAAAIKRSPAGPTVMSLRVTNTAAVGDPQGKVRVKDFQNYSWTANTAARAAWKYPDQE